MTNLQWPLNCRNCGSRFCPSSQYKQQSCPSRVSAPSTGMRENLDCFVLYAEYFILDFIFLEFLFFLFSSLFHVGSFLLIRISFCSLIHSRLRYMFDVHSSNLFYVIVSPSNNYLSVKESSPSAHALAKSTLTFKCAS